MPVIRTSHYSASFQASAVSCQLYELFGWEATNQPRWLQLFNAAALPVDGAVPLVSIKAGTQDIGTFRPLQPILFASGCYVVSSSTGNVLTATADPFWVDLWLVQHI